MNTYQTLKSQNNLNVNIQCMQYDEVFQEDRHLIRRYASNFDSVIIVKMFKTYPMKANYSKSTTIKL